jgi:hypothetical protein
MIMGTILWEAFPYEPGALLRNKRFDDFLEMVTHRFSLLRLVSPDNLV